MKEADGSKTSGLILTYLEDELDNLDEITTAKLSHFFSEVYGADYGANADKCLSGLERTRAAVNNKFLASWSYRLRVNATPLNDIAAHTIIFKMYYHRCWRGWKKWCPLTRMSWGV